MSDDAPATTVMLGSVAWPLLRGAGYRPEVAGAMLSAAGIGALLSPPTLGAAAFLIAEFLRISYLHVLVMALVPTVLYYLSIFVMIEGDARRVGGNGDTQLFRVSHAGKVECPRFRGWHHFTSLGAIAVFMASGMSAFRAVFWATIVAIAASFLRRETAGGRARLLEACARGRLPCSALPPHRNDRHHPSAS